MLLASVPDLATDDLVEATERLSTWPRHGRSWSSHESARAHLTGGQANALKGTFETLTVPKGTFRELGRAGWGGRVSHSVNRMYRPNRPVGHPFGLLPLECPVTWLTR